jgi:predicted membrane protein
MYAALWRVLPGPWWVRLLIVLVALAVILAGLVFWVFPWIDQFTIQQDVTVEGP